MQHIERGPWAEPASPMVNPAMHAWFAVQTLEEDPTYGFSLYIYIYIYIYGRQNASLPNSITH